jgi:hypothetical protein
MGVLCKSVLKPMLATLCNQHGFPGANWERRMSRCSISRWIVGLIGFLCSFGWAEEEKQRPYKAGSLVAEDFQAQPDLASPRWALIKTELRFEYRYQYENIKTGVRMWLSHVEAFACMDRAASWNKHPRDAALLAHEQGHFDLAHRQALLMTRESKRRIELSDTTFRVQAADIEAGVTQLEHALQVLVDEHSALLRAEDKKYDETTKNGADDEAQVAWRKKILADIEQLQSVEESREEPKREPKQ